MRLADGGADLAPELVVTGGNHEVAIGRLEGLVGSVARVRGPHAPARTAGAEILTGLQRRHPNEAAQHRTVDAGSPAGLLPFQQRRDEGIGGIEPGTEIADRHATLDRPAMLFPGDTHQPAHGLDGDIESPLTGIRSRLSIAADGAEDQSRVERRQALVGEAVTGHHPRAKVLDDDIGFPAELMKRCSIRLILDIQGNAALVAVHRGEVLTEGHALGIGGLRWPFPHPVPPTRSLDLDHIGPEIREQRACKRPCRDLPELQDAHAVEKVLIAHCCFLIRCGSPPASPSRGASLRP